MASVWSCTREDVKAALDSKETARNNAQIDRLIGSSARSIEEQMHRRFYPTLATREFDWPDLVWDRDTESHRRRLWLDEHELISVASLTVSGTAIAGAGYHLDPVNDGPPYAYIEFDEANGTAAAAYDGTRRSAVQIAGLYGGDRNDEVAVGQLVAGLAAGAAATANVSWTTARFGVGDILRIDTERMIVTDRTMVDSGQNLGAPGLTAQANAVTVPVTNGAGFAVDEIILIDSERMLVVDIAGNNLTVKRAWDGSILAAHSTNADIYTLTGVELARGQLGTADASHLTSAVIYRHVKPDLIRQLNIAETVVALMQENAGYGRVIGSGDSQREAAGKGLEDLRMRAYNAHGRKVF